MRKLQNLCNAEWRTGETVCCKVDRLGTTAWTENSQEALAVSVDLEEPRTFL